MTIERRRMLLKAFIGSKFAYCPLVWMCCNRSCNNRINHLHDTALRIVYNDNVSSFQDLLKRGQPVRIHHRNIRLLGMKLYKTRNNISSHIMNELFEQRNIIYNLRSQTDFTTGPISTVNNEPEKILDLKFGRSYHLILEILETLKTLRGKLSVGLL